MKRKARNYGQKQTTQLPEVVDREEIKRMVLELINEDKKQEKPKREEARVIDCSLHSWEQFEEKFQQIEDKMQLSDGMAGDDDFDITLYTDAWDPRRIFEFCMIYWDTLNIEDSTIRRDNADILTFASYYTALAEVFLAAQDSIDGIDGHTRDSIRNAKYELERRKIPEFIGDMYLGLRAIVLKEERVRVVLIPHQCQTRGGNRLINNQIQLVNNQVNIRFRPSILIRKNAFQPANAPVQLAANMMRTCWVEQVLTFLHPRAPGEYSPDEMNALLGYGHLMKRFAQSTFCANLALPVHFTYNWYDYWLQVNLDAVVDKWTGRLLLGLGNSFMYKPRFHEHLPCQVVDVQADIITWSEVSEKEQWIPWFCFDTLAHARAFRAGIAAQCEQIDINRLHQRNAIPIPQRAYAQRMSRLVRGALKALIAPPP